MQFCNTYYFFYYLYIIRKLKNNYKKKYDYEIKNFTKLRLSCYYFSSNKFLLFTLFINLLIVQHEKE